MDSTESVESLYSEWLMSHDAKIEVIAGELDSNRKLTILLLGCLIGMAVVVLAAPNRKENAK